MSHPCATLVGMKVSFLHSSDVHIGMSRWFLNDVGAGREFEAARLDALRRLGEIAKERGCAFIVLAGDNFDANSLETRVSSRAIEALKAMPVPVYLLPGNHDPLTPESVYNLLRQQAPGAYVIENSAVLTDPSGCEIIGAPLTTKRAMKDLVAVATADLEPSPNIRVVVGHGQVEARSNEIQPDLIDLAQLEVKLATGAIDYVAMGDTHSAQALGDTGAVWYSGSPEVTDFTDLDHGGGEVGSGHALVVTIEKTTAGPAQVVVEQVPVGRWRFYSLHREVMGAEDVQEFLETLRALPTKDTTVVKYSLAGTIDVAASRALAEGLGELTPLFANLYERQRLMDLHLEPTEDELSDLELTGVVRRAFETLRDSADPAATDAMHLMFRLMKGQQR